MKSIAADDQHQNAGEADPPCHALGVHLFLSSRRSKPRWAELTPPARLYGIRFAVTVALPPDDVARQAPRRARSAVETVRRATWVESSDVGRRVDPRRPRRRIRPRNVLTRMIAGISRTATQSFVATPSLRSVTSEHKTSAVPGRESRSVAHERHGLDPRGRVPDGLGGPYPEERPVHRVAVDGFWIDEHPVTVAAIPPLRERDRVRHVGREAPDPADYPKAIPELMVPGSIVFTGSNGPVDLSDCHSWWSWIPGAQWRHPEGPESTLHGRETTPCHPRRPPGRLRLRRLGREGAPNRSGMGVRRPRRTRRQGLHLGRRVRPEGRS